MNTEIQTINNILSNESYELTKEDTETPTVLLALQSQQRLKSKIKYKTPNYKYLHEDKLMPPSYQPSPEEISLAMCRSAMEDQVWTTVHYLSMHIDSLQGKELSFPYTKENVEKSSLQALQRWNKAMDKWDDNTEMWECFIGKEWFEKVYTDSLSDMHSGDCTAFASSCSRCHAEQLFKIPQTATWGKSEGYRMYNEYLKKTPI